MVDSFKAKGQTQLTQSSIDPTCLGKPISGSTPFNAVAIQSRRT
jgi:hypothetical protein